MSKKSNVHEITVKIEGEEWKNAVNKAFNKLNKTAKIDGFRPGKAPRNMYEKKYGKASLYDEAINEMLDEKYMEVLKENNLEPVVRPEVNIKSVSDDALELLFTITTKPEVNIKKYKNLGLKKEEVKVTKEEVENRIEELQKQYAEIVIKDDKIDIGDTAIIDFEGFKDGVAFSGGKGENYPLEIGSHTFIPGFEEQLVGMKKDEEKDINVKFPEDYLSEDLKGKEVTFKVKVREVKTKTLPELDEEFFLDLGLDDIKTKEDLLKSMKEEITKEKEYTIENKYVDDLLEEVSKNTEVDIPQEFVDNEVYRMFNQFSDNVKMQGITVEQYLLYIQKTEDEIKESMKEEATKRVKYRMILEEIAVLENIEISDDDAEKEAEHLATHYQMTKEELIKAFGGLDMIKYDLQMRRALEIIQDK